MPFEKIPWDRLAEQGAVLAFHSEMCSVPGCTRQLDHVGLHNHLQPTPTSEEDNHEQ